MTDAATITGPCVDCGAEVERERAEGGFVAQMLSDLPLRCDGCTAAIEEREAEREAEELREREARVNALRAERRRTVADLPGELAGFTFADVVEDSRLDRAMELARGWAAGERAGVGLTGTVGTGKTRIAAAAANEMLLRRQVHWYSAPLLLARLGTGSFDSDPRQRALEALTGTGALVLDDLDKARPTEYAAEVLFLAVDARADGAAPLLVTTNLAPTELASRWPQPYGEAIASRLALMSWVRLEGEDRRALRGRRG